MLAALYRLLAWHSPQGTDAFVLANDEDQAGDDLDLTKKLVACNPVLSDELDVYAKEIARKDGAGVLRILPAKDVAGAHGKTYCFCGFGEIHAYRDYGIFEALAPDPTRLDALIWITSYASIFNSAGYPLFDFYQRGVAGADPRMFFSWYSADYCTDPAFAQMPPERRANPSIESWGNPDYLEQQRRRLPIHKFRRLHLNLPGMPDGAYLQPQAVFNAIIQGRKLEQPRPTLPEGRRTRYYCFVDMSGGSQDDAVLGVAYRERGQVRLARLVSQTQRPPFNPRHAIAKFAPIVKEYGCSGLTGDHYAGNTFASDFAEHGLGYHGCNLTRSELYEALEPLLNSGRAELLDEPKLQEQLLGLVRRGEKIDHSPGEHDDYANAAAGAVVLAYRGGESTGESADVIESRAWEGYMGGDVSPDPRMPGGLGWFQ